MVLVSRNSGVYGGGFYRVRSGKIRIIVEFQFERNYAFVEEVDWRGNVYK